MPFIVLVYPPTSFAKNNYLIGSNPCVCLEEVIEHHTRLILTALIYSGHSSFFLCKPDDLNESL